VVVVTHVGYIVALVVVSFVIAVLVAFVAVVADVAVAAFPVVLWLPAVFTPGKLILALPLNDTPPIVLAVCRVVAVDALPLNAAVIVQ
jgi:hypothetical protein